MDVAAGRVGDRVGGARAIGQGKSVGGEGVGRGREIAGRVLRGLALDVFRHRKERRLGSWDKPSLIENIFLVAPNRAR